MVLEFHLLKLRGDSAKQTRSIAYFLRRRRGDEL